MAILPVLFGTALAPRGVSHTVARWPVASAPDPDAHRKRTMGGPRNTPLRGAHRSSERGHFRLVAGCFAGCVGSDLRVLRFGLFGSALSKPLLAMSGRRQFLKFKDVPLPFPPAYCSLVHEHCYSELLAVTNASSE
jgi:hypothetical protein